ncbi:MAG: DNA-3-methyladenine glycosylase 2 family protein [Caldilinea sp.]|jgi:DNA-3-methyladenine glycosylase II|nr:DNA-3-methyladenine glycosylase 2 family protein [Caldilinea sp.]
MSTAQQMALLSEANLPGAVDALAAQDADLARLVSVVGYPPLWAREPGFATLVLMILEQQVSLASARATFVRLETVAGGITPAALLALDDPQLRAAGLSRQKSGYVRGLAAAVEQGDCDLELLTVLDDQSVRARLTALKGIGEWTAELYLLMALRRPDAWPAGDLALASALQQVKRLEQRPTAADQIALAEAWRPWRAVAARLLWQFYLARRPF